jgi:hypothetical protein
MFVKSTTVEQHGQMSKLQNFFFFITNGGGGEGINLPNGFSIVNGHWMGWLLINK